MNLGSYCSKAFQQQGIQNDNSMLLAGLFCWRVEMGSEIKPRLWNCILIGPSCTKYKRWSIENTYPFVTQYIILLAGACQPRPLFQRPACWHHKASHVRGKNDKLT